MAGTRTARATFAAAAVVMLAAGCGSGDPCEALADDLDAVEAQLSSASTEAEAEDGMRELGRISQESSAEGCNLGI